MRDKIHNFNSFINENINISQHNVKKILENYLEAAIFTDEEQVINTFEEDNPDGNPDDIDFNIHNFDDDTIKKSTEDIENFLKAVGSAADGIDDTMLGHDFWLTRNGHGANFRDRGYDEDITNILVTEAAKFKTVNLFYLEDVGKLMIE